jgi:4-amino-4-deoxy-L-arabinose transferase-like glycosyltransferase
VNRLSGTPRLAFALVLSIAAALVVAPWRGHVDDIDAQVYEVVARNMVADGTWFDLRYLPDVWPLFREHLPFSFWPAAATIRLFGEGAVNLLYACFTLATVWLAGWMAARIQGGWGGVAAALVLGTCESIWQYGGRFLLEPPLLLFATAAAGAALLPRPRWYGAAAFGALAVLMKGPFGLLPLACVVLGRAISERSWPLLVRGALSGLLAIVPAALFLILDRWLGNGTWWTGYFERRLLGWAAGGASEGLALRWFPLQVIANRFWPGLPLVAYGFWLARRERRLQPLAIACILGMLLLCAPERKWGNHAYVLFPLLAVFAGAAVGPVLERALSAPRQQRVVQALAVATVLTWVSSLMGGARLVLSPPCVVSKEFAAELSSLPAGSPIWVVAPTLDWLLIGALASERRLVPVISSALTNSPGPRLAIVRENTSFASPWSARTSARGWTLLRR